MGSQSAILGCLLGTAAGDSIGLPREGLSRIRVSALFGEPPLSQQLLIGRGFCSDDTEHTILTLLAIHEAKGSTSRFEQRLASSFRWWLMRIPAGIGFATLRACVKLWARHFDSAQWSLERWRRTGYAVRDHWRLLGR